MNINGRALTCYFRPILPYRCIVIHQIFFVATGVVDASRLQIRAELVLELNPIRSRLFYSLKVQVGLYTLKMLRIIKASLAKLCSVIVPLKTYQNT